nr:putative transferase caf17, mitochondrial [Quercus suber]
MLANTTGKPQWICASCLRKQISPSTRRSYASFAANTPPPSPPASGVAKLTSRRLISLHGPEAPKFLQGIITSNVRDDSSAGFYAAFLTAQGKVLNDVFIFPTLTTRWHAEQNKDGEQGFLVDVDSDQADTLLKHIKRHKLRSKFKLRLLDEGELDVWSVWKEGDRWTAHTQSATNELGGLTLVDSRASGMGQRMLLSSSSASALVSEVQQAPSSAYTIRRYVRGVAEGQREIPRDDCLPMNYNFDIMGGIDFTKGCYIGQELTIRTHHTGVVRRRILPVQLYDSASAAPDKLEYNPGGSTPADIPNGADMKRDDKRQKPSGKLIASIGNVGLGMCRLEQMSDLVVSGENSTFSPDGKFFVAAGDESKIGVKAFVPDWLRGRIRAPRLQKRVEASSHSIGVRHDRQLHSLQERHGSILCHVGSLNAVLTGRHHFSTASSRSLSSKSSVMSLSCGAQYASFTCWHKPVRTGGSSVTSISAEHLATTAPPSTTAAPQATQHPRARVGSQQTMTKASAPRIQPSSPPQRQHRGQRALHRFNHDPNSTSWPTTRYSRFLIPSAASNLPKSLLHLDRTTTLASTSALTRVRCDLGSVDNPHDPPCKRCSRESKECFFSATRRKKKGGRYGSDDGESEGEEVEYTVKSGRKRARTSLSARSETEQHEAEESDEPRTPGGSKGRSKPLSRPAPAKPVVYGEEDHKVSDMAAGVLQFREVHSGHDALKVLSDLASGAASYRHGSNASLTRPVGLTGISPSSLPPATSPVVDRPSHAGGNMQRQATDAARTASVQSADSIAYASALRAWSRFRFVRAGWFTAKEAIDYVQYFYTYLAPLTPVAVPDFRAPSEHERLLTQELMLTVTILLIASRHMQLEGPGKVTRPQSIHDKLWKYLSGMVDRVIWGQEQFGGGFCQAGSEPGADVNPLSRKGLRTLGTVESLVLITEWHPRAMHFPPEEDDEELMIPDERILTPDLNDSDPSVGIGGQRMDAWLEPCWRSDRMCWMLLGISTSLAFEIGVFDTSDWQRHAKSANGKPLSAEDLRAYDWRRSNVRDLLLVYVTQTSGRLGLTSMLPGNYSKPEDSRLYRAEIGQHNGLKETILHFWLRMAAIMREGNQRVFANKEFTRDLIRNGDYKAALEQLQRPVDEWRRDFDRCAAIPKHMRYILEIEYEYCRVYLNALPLQAVAERCASEQASTLLDHPLESTARNGLKPDPAAIAPETLAKQFGGDRKYMVLVGDSARNLLKIVVDGLAAVDYLKHAPVRTYFRIISVAIMLLKSFSLGASENDVADSLTLLDRTVEALRTSVVDDVHVASRFADLLDTLTQSLKPRLVRISADGRAGRSRRVSQYDTSAAVLAAAGASNQYTQNQYQQQSNAGTSTAQSPWSYNQGLPGNGQMSSLFGVSNELYNLASPNNQFSVMPPPNYSLASPSSNTATNLSPAGNGHAVYDYNGFAMDPGQDWLTLPLDPLINYSGSVDVSSTMYGPEVGGQDMLELLLGTGNGNSGF